MVSIQKDSQFQVRTVVAVTIEHTRLIHMSVVVVQRLNQLVPVGMIHATLIFASMENANRIPFLQLASYVYVIQVGQATIVTQNHAIVLPVKMEAMLFETVTISAFAHVRMV